MKLDADSPRAHVAFDRVGYYLKGHGLLVPGAVQRCGGKQAHVVFPPAVPHEIVDEPTGRRAPCRSILAGHHDEEISPRTDKLAAFFEAIEHHLDRRIRRGRGGLGFGP